MTAAAGYGKSTLVAAWLAERDRRAAWLSLDEGDNDLRQFVSYVVAAVETLFPEACHGTAALLKAPELPPLKVLTGHLCNELDAIGEPFTLVLDDYQSIRETAIHDLASELLRHPPMGLQLMILARRDPPLPLASLRAGDSMAEIRFDDLRFSESEAAELMEEALGRALSGAALSQAQEITEGWVAGLHLVALAIRQKTDPEGFLLSLRGGIREIQDYLMAEVLCREPAEFQQCMLRTSVVDRFSASFCGGVCEKCDECPLAGEQMMANLAHMGVFLIPLDPAGEWYRYHHLFRDFLRERLEREVGAEGLADLHLRASHWFEEMGLNDEAIDHALKAGEPARAAEIVESHLHAELNADRWQLIERWLRRIPEEVRQERPQLLLGAACVAIERARLEDLPALVERIETLVDDDAAEPELLGGLNFLRGEVRLWQGEPRRSLEFFLEAREQIPSSQHFVGGENELYAGLALQAMGHHDQAREELQQSRRDAGSGAPVYLSRLVAGQTFVDTLAGELAAAAEGARRLESIGKKHGIGYIEFWGAYMETLAQFHWFEIDAAVRGFSGVAEKAYLMHSRLAADTMAGLALCHQFGGEPGGANTALQKLREFANESGNAELRTVAGSCEVRLAVWRGDLEPALRWQRSFREPLDFPSMLFWLEVPAMTECRVLIARGREADLEEAEVKLAALGEGLGNLHNTCQFIDVTALHAMALEKMGQSEKALETLGMAVALAERGGWIRPFVEIGAPMGEILSRFAPPVHTADFVGRLLEAIAEGAADAAKGPAVSITPPAKQPLIEPLTNRELDVLELIGNRLYDKEIADQLSISPGTVKSHLKHIYQKLDVGNRRQAVEKAKALQII